MRRCSMVTRRNRRCRATGSVVRRLRDANHAHGLFMRALRAFAASMKTTGSDLSRVRAQVRAHAGEFPLGRRIAQCITADALAVVAGAAAQRRTPAEAGVQDRQCDRSLQARPGRCRRPGRAAITAWRRWPCPR
ncbi:hypothetical protein [Lysobacter gummosus]|uniref:hypothetical protein n=1 Tax=Lysobacter gummosus TaxID=262324 RepID=UPI003633ECA7